MTQEAKNNNQNVEQRQQKFKTRVQKFLQWKTAVFTSNDEQRTSLGPCGSTRPRTCKERVNISI